MQSPGTDQLEGLPAYYFLGIYFRNDDDPWCAIVLDIPGSNLSELINSMRCSLSSLQELPEKTEMILDVPIIPELIS